MDLLTQGLLGAALAQAGSKQQETRVATGVGFFAGLIADADILIQSDQDPLLTVEFHRHFTHSIFCSTRGVNRCAVAVVVVATQTFVLTIIFLLLSRL